MSDTSVNLGSKITLPSSKEEFIVPKLKAGAYYSAQKIYISWLQALQGVFTGNGVSLDDAKDEKGEINTAKLEETVRKNSATLNTSTILDQISIANEMRSELVATCLGKTKDEVLDEFFPEDLEVITTKILEVNNFMDNLKKSVAPMVEVGQKEEASKETTA